MDDRISMLAKELRNFMTEVLDRLDRLEAAAGSTDAKATAAAASQPQSKKSSADASVAD
jgi:hypothetical protein|nr:MAG TPA: hypothetical protein [Caudoviricetes sp.]